MKFLCKLLKILLRILTRKREKDTQQLECLQWIMKEDVSTKKSETELRVSNHVITTADQLIQFTVFLNV